MTVEHRDLSGASLHPSKVVTFTGNPSAYTPTQAGILVECLTAPWAGYYTTTGTTAGAVRASGVATAGAAATIAVGDVVTVAAGQPAAVANSGTSAAAVFDFEIPQGAPGPAATIAIGDVATVAAGGPATVMNVGTSTDVVLDFEIPQGEQGEPGAAATIAIGDVTPGDVVITNAGTSSEAVFDFDFSGLGGGGTAGAIPASSAAPTGANPAIDPATGQANIILQTGTPPKLWIGVGATQWASVDLSVFVPPASLLTNLISWYKFQDSLGSTTPPAGPTLSVLGAGSPVYTTAGLDKSINTSDGTYGITSTDAAFNNLHLGFHIAVVARTPFVTDTYEQEALISQHRSFGNSKFRCYLGIPEISSNPGFSMELNDSSGEFGLTKHTGIQPTANQWFLIEIYQSSTSFGLAINNGVFVTQALPGDFEFETSAASNVPLNIGMDRSSSTAFNGGVFNWKGDIDMVAIWSAPFSDLSPTGAERAALWNGGSFRSDP